MRRTAWVRVAAMSAAVWSPSVFTAPAVPDGVWVRPGYELTVAVTNITKPRFMARSPDGVLFVSRPDKGEIAACRDADGDGFFEASTTFVKDFPSAHGMQWHDGWLWFTQTQAIRKARDKDGDGVADEVVEVIGPDVFPMKGGHWWRSILIHKGRLYTSVGDGGNINDETATKRQKIWSYALDGSGEKLFCSGLRNTEKLMVRPGTDEIWGMDHGSDWFGGVMEKKAKAGQPITDMNPPCEMNHYVEGGFYGHPFIVGKRVPRYEFMDRPDIVELAAKTTPPEWCSGAHWAPNAMCFYTGSQFPDTAGDAFVAYHGSWNSSIKVGYSVTRVHFEDGHPWGERPYVKFFSKDGRVLGRPVDVLVEPDGSLLISEDFKHTIYRLRYKGAGAGT